MSAANSEKAENVPAMLSTQRRIALVKTSLRQISLFCLPHGLFFQVRGKAVNAKNGVLTVYFLYFRLTGKIAADSLTIQWKLSQRNSTKSGYTEVGAYSLDDALEIIASRTREIEIS